jgi:hypothetical protein
MNIEKNIHGVYIIAEMVTDGRNTWRESRQYYGYKRSEAIALYVNHIENMGCKPLTK